MAGDPARIGMRCNNGAVRQPKHLRRPLVGEMRDVRHNAILRQSAHNRTAKVCQRAARFAAEAQLVFAHPGECQQAHPVTLQLVKALETPSQHRPVLYREQRRVLSGRPGRFQFRGTAAKNDPVGMKPHLPYKTGVQAAIGIVGRIPPGLVVQYKQCEYLRPFFKRLRLGKIEMRVGVGKAAPVQKPQHGIAVQIEKIQYDPPFFAFFLKNGASGFPSRRARRQNRALPKKHPPASHPGTPGGKTERRRKIKLRPLPQAASGKGLPQRA